MKLTIIDHNMHGLNDHESILKIWCFLNTLTLRVDIVIIQNYKLKGMSLENVGYWLMSKYTCCNLAVPFENQSWKNLNVARNDGIGVHPSNNFTRLVTIYGALYEDGVFWIKFEGIRGGTIGLTYAYVPNIHTEWQYLWYIMANTLPMVWNWIVREVFKITKK